MTRPGWELSAPPGKEGQLLSRIARDTDSLLNNGLKIADNMLATIAKFRCVHGVETLIPKGTLKGNNKALFFQPMYSTVDEAGLTPALPVLGTNPLNLTRSDGQMGLTVRFAPPINMLGVTKNATQTGAGGVGTLITWQTTEYIQGTFAYTGAGVVTMPESGFVRVSCDIIFNGNGVAGDGYGIHVANTVTGKRWAQVRAGISTAANSRLNASDEFPVTAGDTYAMYMNQFGTVRDVLWTSTADNTRFGLSYTAPPVGYAAWVHGILWGG